MSLGIDFPVLSTGSVFTSVDTYNPALINNGAQVPLGSVYNEPLFLARIGVLANGIGKARYVKYVRYNPTASQAILAGPTPVYWKDETFTTVTGLLSEAVYAGANAFAGWLLYNTATLPTATAAQINGNFCYICVGGFIANAVAPAATAPGDIIIGAAGAFTPARIAAGTPSTNKIAGFALTAVVNGVCDIEVPFTS